MQEAASDTPGICEKPSRGRRGEGEDDGAGRAGRSM